MPVPPLLGDDAMVDEMDPDLDAANQRQDATDAAKFRSDAAALREEATHARAESAKLKQMGLAAESDRFAKEAVALDKSAADFEHRADLLTDAIRHRTSADRFTADAAKAGTAATAAHAQAGQIHDHLEKGPVDLDDLAELTADEAAARAREASLLESQKSYQEIANIEITLNAVGEERDARAGLPGRGVELKPGLVDPWASGAASSLLPDDPDQYVAASDPIAPDTSDPSAPAAEGNLIES
jgi:hypothetical protein